MKYVLVLEDDLKLRTEMYEALRLVGPQVQIRFFDSLEHFHIWLKAALADGPRSLASAGVRFAGDSIADAVASDDDVLSLVVSKDEFLGSRQMNLMKRTLDMFIRKKLCSKEEPTSLIITAFDKPGFDIRTVEQRFINNVIYKPFDKPILQQHLLFGIEGRHQAKQSILHNMKTDSMVEMLKDIQFEAWSELGFVTRSDHAILQGALAKYYVRLNPQSELITIYASCYKSIAHPDFPDEFRCFFRLFAPGAGLLNRLRRDLPKTGAAIADKSTDDLLINASNLNCVIIDPEEGKEFDLEKTLKRVFTNVDIVMFRNFSDFVMELDPVEFEKTVKRPKAWGNDEPMKLVYDGTGQFLHETVPDLGEMGEMFGLKKKDLLRFDFTSMLSGVDKIEWKRFILGEQVVHTKFKFSLLGKTFFIAATDRQVTTAAGGKSRIEVLLRELTLEERCEMLKAESRLHGKVDFIFIKESELGENFRDRWDPILQKLERPKLFLMGSNEIQEHKLRPLGRHLTDVFYKPYDVNYILKKLFSVLPKLSAKEDYSVAYREASLSGKVANPIHISEVSEAGLVMNYHRPLELGGFREFILWMPGALEIPIVIGTCNYVEESKAEPAKDEGDKSGDKKNKVIYDNHFVFFGVRDLQLKYIRLWHRDNYILSKKES